MNRANSSVRPPPAAQARGRRPRAISSRGPDGDQPGRPDTSDAKTTVLPR